MKLLIADDDATSRSILAGLTSGWGYSLVVASDGDAALAVMEQPDAPRMAVLDWMMPGIEGVEICRRLRGRGETEAPYLIILTSRGAKADIIRGLDAGANDYISKPFDKDELKARLDVGQRVLELQGALAARVRELEEAAAHIKLLQGIIPICSFCHNIRTDQESWQKIETYLTQHSQAHFSHGICPECMRKHYPEYDFNKNRKQGTPDNSQQP